MQGLRSGPPHHGAEFDFGTITVREQHEGSGKETPTPSSNLDASKQRGGKKSRGTSAATEHAGHQASHPRSLRKASTQRCSHCEKLIVAEQVGERSARERDAAEVVFLGAYADHREHF